MGCAWLQEKNSGSAGIFLEDGNDFPGLSAQLNSSGIGPGNFQCHQSPLFIS
jgi:hypothetical protein